MHSWHVRLYLLHSHFPPSLSPATDGASAYTRLCSLDLPSVCSGSLRERERQLVCICIEPYGDWNSDWIGVLSSSSSCAWLVYDKSVALTSRVGREQDCLWSDKLHIRALFNILYMATSNELLRCQIEEQWELQHCMQKC